MHPFSFPTQDPETISLCSPVPVQSLKFRTPPCFSLHGGIHSLRLCVSLFLFSVPMEVCFPHVLFDRVLVLAFSGMSMNPFFGLLVPVSRLPQWEDSTLPTRESAAQTC